MNVDLLRRLSEAPGVPSQEEQIREIVKKELGAITSISLDRMGNVICLKKATKKPAKGDTRKLMIAAHMDEIGFIVKFIDDKGFLRLQQLGGWDPRQMAAQRVNVHTKDGPIPGAMTASVKPKHLLSADEAARGVQIEQYFVDCGLSGDDAKKKVRIGDMVTMDRKFVEMGSLFSGKAMDDRVAVFVMIEALKKAKDHSVDVYAVATVQEEVGLRGASAVGSGLAPDVVVALDVTLANDFPGMSDHEHITRLGDGTAIKIMDSSLICHPKVVDHFRKLAEKHKIKHQFEILSMGGTDAGGVQRLHGGIPAFTLSIPTRYIHTVNETCHRDDVQASIDLLARYIEDCHHGDYAYA